MGLPRDMGAVGEAVCDDTHICHPSERSAIGRMDTPPAWDLARLPTSPSTIHTGCGCVGSVHSSAVLERLPRGVSVTRGPYRRTSTAIRR